MTRFFQKIIEFCISREKAILAMIIAVVFAVSFGHSLYFNIPTSVDAEAYDSLGWQIAQGLGFEKGAINRPGPAYEYFLGFIFLLFGHVYSPVWFLQAVLLALVSLMTYHTTKIIFKDVWHPLIGLLAAAFAGFSPDLILLSSMLMTETLVIFLTTASIYLLAVYVDSGKIKFLPLCALMLALGALTRGNSILLAVPFFIYIFFKKDWRAFIVLGFSLLIFLTPWTIRNYLTYGQIKPFNGSAGLLYVGNNPAATGELIPTYPFPEGFDPASMEQIEFDDELGRAGVEYIKNNPLRFVKLTLIRSSIYLSLARPTGFWPYLERSPITRLTVAALSGAHTAALFLAGATGVIIAIYRRFLIKSLWYVLLATLTLPAPYLALVVETRYRTPLYPSLSIFAGFAVAILLIEGWQVIKKYSPIFAVWGVILLNTALDVVRNWDRILEKLR